jgi:hypothetical protein
MVMFGQGRYNLNRFECLSIKIFEMKEVQRQAFSALTLDKYGMIYITACRIGPTDHLQATARHTDVYLESNHVRLAASW